jgi:hypothetical protein
MSVVVCSGGVCLEFELVEKVNVWTHGRTDGWTEDSAFP